MFVVSERTLQNELVRLVGDRKGKPMKLSTAKTRRRALQKANDANPETPTYYYAVIELPSFDDVKIEGD